MAHGKVLRQFPFGGQSLPGAVVSAANSAQDDFPGPILLEVADRRFVQHMAEEYFNLFD
jgi:hypothetical protein